MINKKLLRNLTNKSLFYKGIIAVVLLIITTANFTYFIRANYDSFTRPFYPDGYISYKKIYGESQYVRTNPLHVIPDEFVYAYAAWEYTQGVNPLLLQGETAPLGKYLIGISEKYFNNERIIAPIFNILCLMTLFFLSLMTLKSIIWSLALVTVFSFEKLFVVQMLYAPLLDNIQLFFILLSFVFFILWTQKNKFLVPAFLVLGAVMSVKLWTTGIIVFIIWFIYTLLTKDLKRILKLLIFAPTSLITMLIVFIPSFAHGDDLRRFFGVQKYLFEFHKSKMEIDPTAVWELLLFNKWQVPWNTTIQSSVDWQWTWPLLTLLSFATFIWTLASYKRRRLIISPIGVVLIWFLVYIIFLSLSTILARYILPVLPAMYILSFWLIKTALSGIKYNLYFSNLFQMLNLKGRKD